MNYSMLQSDIADFLNRQDLALQIPVFIRLAESRMNRVVRTRQMETSGSETVSSQYVALPADFLEYRNLSIENSPPIRLEYVTPQEADGMRSSGIQGQPRFFTIVGNQVEFIPAASGQTFDYVYYAKIPALSDMATTNWLLDLHYDLYLYGALVQAALYLKDDPTQWAVLFDSALDEIKVEDERALFNGTTPVMRGISIG